MQRSPFLLNVSDLLGSDASGRSVRVESIVDWKLDLIELSGEAPIVADIMLHPVSGGIAATGSVSFVTQDTCHRCLSPTTTERSASIGALFDRTDDDETYELDGHEIDVEQMLRDEVLLSLPVVTTCGDDCVGVVDSAQNDLNTGASDDEDESRSPFAVLKDLLEPED
ncbi:MAG: DUF177 domain-containing protein [Armatimonadetes bacterium]|nr:MAG: DUF177 domain-containing protein [Armatimonadota bacterium]